jgi:hypothetical protein
VKFKTLYQATVRITFVAEGKEYNQDNNVFLAAKNHAEAIKTAEEDLARSKPEIMKTNTQIKSMELLEIVEFNTMRAVDKDGKTVFFRLHETTSPLQNTVVKNYEKAA